MTASEEPGRNDGSRVRPSGDAWKEAQRRVAESNDRARRAGKAERLAAERRTAAFERAQELRGVVHR
jgi:hypothetical protein